MSRFISTVMLLCTTMGCGPTVAGLASSPAYAEEGSAMGVAKAAWDVIKGGIAVTTASKTVDVIPPGKSTDDYTWEGPAVVEERYEANSFLFGSPVAAFTMSIAWEYDGKYIHNFGVSADGFASIADTVDVRVVTKGATLKNGIYELPYEIILTHRNLTGGTKAVVYKGVVAGNGAGRGGF